MSTSELEDFNLDNAIRANAKSSLGCSVLVVAVGLYFLVPDLASVARSVLKGDWATGIGAGVAALVIFGFGCLGYSSYGDLNDPRRHEIYTRLAVLGPVDEKAADLEKQVRESGQKIGGFIFTPDYLLQLSSLDLRTYTDLVWIYKKQTKHSVNFIPTGTTYEVVIHLRNGNETTQSGDAVAVDQVLTTLADNCPWIVAGYTEELSKLWSKSQAEFIAQVDARRAQFEASLRPG